MESVSITVPATKNGALMLASLAEVLAQGPVSVSVAPTVAKVEASPLNGASAKPAEDKPKAKPKRKRRTKAEIEAEQKANTSSDPFEDDAGYDGMGDPEDDLGLGVSEKTLDMEKDILPKFRAMVEGDPKHGRDKAVKILQEYGVKSVRDIPQEKYSEVFAKL